MGSGVVEFPRWEYRGNWKKTRAPVIEEGMITIHVNGDELATIMATPMEQEELALGFLRNEGLIKGMAEVRDVHVSDDGCCVEVWLDHAFEAPDRTIITSGCGGGVTFDDPSSGIAPLDDPLCIPPEQLMGLFDALQTSDSLYARARGVHTAGLAAGEEILAVAEDVGRHNCIDKLVGQCMLRGIETGGRILLATGRVSSEMLRKGARMKCPVIASRNSPTSMSVDMAQAWNITLVGYVRRMTLRAYSHPERLQCEGLAQL